ncbi:centrosomal protein of 192 kDa isoform X1 [Pogona vitticeps]
MEDLRCIVDETFPSVADHSLASHATEILDNITISSNLGLPVAASTEIRQKTHSHDRLHDQTYYMETRFSAPLASSCCDESDSDPRKKLILNFQNPIKTTEMCLKSDQNDLDCLQRKQNQDCAVECSSNHQDIRCEILSPEHLEDLTTEIFASLEKGSEDYKAAVLEPSQKWIRSETCDNAVTSLSKLIENEKLLSFASLEGNSTDEDVGEEEFCDDQLEAYFEHLVLSEVEDMEEQELAEYFKPMEMPSLQKKFKMPEVNQEARNDSLILSDEEFYDLKEEYIKDEQFMLPMIAKQEEGCMKPSSIAEPNSSADKSPVGIVGDASLVCSRTIHSHDLCLDVEDFDSHREDGTPLKINTVSGRKNDATNITNSALKLDSVYFKCSEDDNVASEIWHTEEKTGCPPMCQTADESHVPLADVYLSPSVHGGSEQDPCTVVGDSPHNVVYQNEEGKWVTDLAYYTSFDKEEILNLSNMSGDFITGSDAVAMIAQDQEDFEREHRFMQEEKMDQQNTSGLGDSSWKSISNYNPLRTSQADFSKDASYLRLSLGEFFGQRSEALGCLGGGDDVKRPSFGYHITSPQKRQPVPLLRQSDVSTANSDKQNLQISDTLQGNVEKSMKEEPHVASATFAFAQVDTPGREYTRENLEERKVGHEHPDIEPFVLSISTIASAIANASVSAEPSQLAALMMKLSDKHREGTDIPDIGKLTDFSVLSQLLSSNIENSPFDIEKYLRRTGETENDSKSENIIKHEETTTDGHKLFEISNAGDLSKNNFNIKYGKENQCMEKILEESGFKESHCDISSKQKKEMENTKAPCNTGESFQSEKLACVPSSKEELSENANLPSEASATTVPILASPLPGCLNKETTMHEVKYQQKQDGKVLKRNASCSNEKHVTFENASPDSRDAVGAAVLLTEQKLSTPVPGVKISDDEQRSFRPSTSPLIHSSPSEASETALSGSDCPFTTPNFKESSCNDKMLPQTEYNDPSFRRLTFVSATEKTLTLCSPEQCRNNRASELSTTIVWTSPTSLLEGDTGKNTAFQNNKQPSQITSTRNYSQKQERNESTYSVVPEDQKSTREFQQKSGDQSKQSCGDNTNRGQVDTPAGQHDYAYTAHRPTLFSLKNVPAYNDLYGCISLNQDRADFKPHGATSGIPTLLTGCSLRTTPFAQQYLGSLPSHTGVALPQYHVGFPSTFGLPAGLIYSTIPLGHIQNSLTTGMSLSSDVRPGVLGTASDQNVTTSQNVCNSTSRTGKASDAAGPRQWEESVPFGFAHVKVPEEVKFPNACCVGLTSHTVLRILNPSERWLQVSISLLSIMFNGEKVEPQKHRCLLFKNKTVIGPCTTEELKMLFLPCQAGVFQCVLSVASWPFSADADTIVQAEALAARVIVNAVAENPDIEVEAGKSNHLDFGDLPSGSWKVLPLKLTNKTCARVPVRLVIHANAVAWRCFTFCKEPVDPSVKSAAPTHSISQLAAPSVISHVMNASCDGQDPEVLMVWVQFHAPSKYITSDCLGSADEYFARIDVEVDCPEPANVLRSIPLSARSGTPRIYAPKSLQTLYMSANMGSSTKQQLPLKNAGNITVNLKIMILETDSCISVKPEHLVLIPGEEQEVTVEFSPKDCRGAESVVKILVLPSGPEYKVTVKGEVTVAKSKPLVQKCSNTEDPPILANKQFLSWGGVQLGRTVQQKLILRNGSASTTQQLRLLIRGQDQDCFQLKLGKQAYNNCEIKIRPKHDYNVFLTFTPTRFACMFAKLEMKQLGLLSQLGIKFTIPLYGYGGKSNVRVEDVKKHGNRYILGLYEQSSDKRCQASFTVRNTGCRAAYVKALCFKNFSERIIMDPNVMRIFPEKFVLKEGSQQKVTVTCNFTEEQNRSLMLSTICLFYGDEILRQQYCRSTQHHLEQLQNILPANNPVINVKFDEEFTGEELVTEVYDLPQQPNDIQCFFTNMRRVTLSAVKTSALASDIKPSSINHLGLQRPAILEKHSMTLDVLPVKGPHGCVLSTNTNELDENKYDSQDIWTLEPEFLIFTAPSQSGTTITKYTRITNNSARSLKFELSWPAHCLTITPQHGVIEPGNTISIRVSPNPSLAENKSILPWSGLIYIHCDGVQKVVRVQIREDSSEEQFGRGSSAGKARVQQQQQQSELPVILIQPIQKLPLTKLEVKNRTVCFPETRSGKTSEKYLEIENNGDENVKWFLSSFAPPYVKDVDENGEVYRATYTAFRCSCLSGTIEAHGKEKVVVIFLPRDKGHYSQFWDLECHPLHDPHMKDKHRLQFCGMGILGKEIFRNEASLPALVKISVRDVSQRECPDSFDQKIWKGVCAQEDVYTFPPTRIGESSTVKISMRNYSAFSNQLKFRSPKAPFYIKHSQYTLRCHHYCNLPVQFKPIASGTFKDLLVVETDKSGVLTIQLIGEGFGEQVCC